MAEEDTDLGTGPVGFPSTHWSQLAAVRGELTDEHRRVLNYLLEYYWRPVYRFLRQTGRQDQDAKDLTQGFFTLCLQKHIFGQADPSRGRFRTFLVACLENFVRNEHRAANALMRKPPAGILSLDQLVTAADAAYEPSGGEQPEAVFHREWLRELLARTAGRLQREFAEGKMSVHYELFRLRILEPALEGGPAPALEELAKRFDLQMKEASNRVITARRAYQRLLREEIHTYAATKEDLAAEVQDLFNFLSAEH